jgi:ABC-type amino acid transport substrate-binding protein
MRKYLLFLFFCFFIISCSHAKREIIKVGVDLKWTNFPITSEEKSCLNGFVDDLLLNIADITNVEVEKFAVVYDELVYGLNAKKFDFIISFDRPYNFNLDKYVFSSILFHPGMVLLVMNNTSYKSLKDFSDKIILYPESNGAILLLQNYSGIIMRPYSSASGAIHAMVEGGADGVLVQHLMALSFMNNLYVGQLKLIGPLEEEEGMRMVALKERGDLMEKLNKAIKLLERKDVLMKLKSKWHLY